MTGMTTDDVLAEVGSAAAGGCGRSGGRPSPALSETTGISVSTLSRLESGLRKPSLELLLPIAQAHQVPLDELVGAPPVGDPAGAARAARHGTAAPSGRSPGSPAACRPSRCWCRGRDEEPEPRTHEGYEWLYVLAGRLRLVLGEHDVVMTAGEAAEFDTRVPHWFGSTGEGPAEFLSLFGPQGERMHVRARPRKA